MSKAHVLAAATVLSMIAGGAWASPGHGSGEGFSGGQPGHPEDVTRIIEIEAVDTAFNPGEIVVEAGETIRFVVTNTGELEHDFTLGTVAVQENHRAEMMQMMMSGKDMMDGVHDDPNAVLVMPGQTRELVWQFDEAETMQFGCNIPGHYESGMFGPIDIRPEGISSSG